MYMSALCLRFLLNRVHHANRSQTQCDRNHYSGKDAFNTDEITMVDRMKFKLHGPYNFNTRRFGERKSE